MVAMLFALPDMGEVWEWLPRWNPFGGLFYGRASTTGWPWLVGLCIAVSVPAFAIARRSFRRRVA